MTHLRAGSIDPKVLEQCEFDNFGDYQTLHTI